MELQTKQEYENALRMYKAYEKASKEYCVANATNCIAPEVYTTFPFHKEVTNELRSAIETYEFINDPPKTYFLYVDKNGIATTWTGQRLGDVMFLNEYCSNFGDKRQSIRVKAINGLNYYGTFYKSAGDYARIKAMKSD